MAFSSFGAAPSAAAPKAKPHAAGFHPKVLGCISQSQQVIHRRGCTKLTGSIFSSLLSAVSSLRVEGSSVYLSSFDASAVTQIGLAPSGALSFQSCITGDSFTEGCTTTPGAKPNEREGPLAGASAQAFSPDGRTLYVAGSFYDATVTWLHRDPASGTLTYGGCLTGTLAAAPPEGPCTPVPGATKDGHHSGLDEARGLAVSKDGSHVYVTASRDEGVAVLARDPASGDMTLQSCVASERGAPGCGRAPASVLEEAAAPVLSPDGHFLTVLGRHAGTVDVFSVGGSGSLKFRSCVSRYTSPPCADPGRAAGGTYTLQAPTGMVESPDGRFLYVRSYGEVVALKRSRASGKLSAVGCASSMGADRRICANLPFGSGPTGSPILSRNGRIMFFANRASGITELRRDPHTGKLAFAGCTAAQLRLKQEPVSACAKLPGATKDGSDSGFDGLNKLALGPGGVIFAATGREDATVTALRP